MSFSSDVKKELTTLEPGKKCCQLAEIALYLRFSGSITLSGGVGLRSSTGNPAVARYYAGLIKDYFGVKTALTVLSGAGISRGRSYELFIGPEMNSDAVLRECGILSVKEGSNYFTDTIGPDVARKRCCKKAALRGAFMAAGTVSSPSARGYHLEIRCSSQALAEDIKKLMTGFGLSPRYTLRSGRYVVYLKDGEQIADFLSLVGANSQMFSFRDAKIYKDLRNTTVRAQNCEMANLEKTINAAQKQLADIRIIEETRGLDSLPHKLYEAAVKRIENPSLGLTDLAALFDPPLGKSGLNHRFEKIAQLAKGIKE